MGIGAPKNLTECREFFLVPQHPRQRIYEALRAYFVEERRSAEVARAFGYTPGSFRVLCHHFRRDPDPVFFVAPKPGPQARPKKAAARDLAVALRKQNHSVYEISEALEAAGVPLSPTAVRELLREEGFAALPRRLDDERPDHPRPTVEPEANIREFSLAPRRFETRCGGLFLFVHDLVDFGVDALAERAGLPGSRKVPAAHAMRAALATKLWGIEHRSHIMALVADEGLALFAGLNSIPKRSFLSEYSSRFDPSHTLELLTAWNERVRGGPLLPGQSFNLDFHSVPYYGEDAIVESHYVSMRSRRQKSVLAFLAQDADGHSFCYSNADLRKGEERGEVLRFVNFWEKTHGERPRQLVFDSQLTSQPHLKTLDDLGIEFITLRRRSPKLLREVANLPRSAWRRVDLDVPARKYKHPRVYEQTVSILKRSFRQFYVLDLGHDEATILLTNGHASAAKLLTRYAQRMLIENALSDGVRFFHMNALSSAVGMKVDFDMALLVIASGLYRLLGHRMRGYAHAQARQIFRDLVDTPADVEITENEVVVRYHRRAHLPILLASELFKKTVAVPWWEGKALRLGAK